MAQKLTMDRIKSMIRRRNPEYYQNWFSRGAMRFFGTRLSRQGYKGRGGLFFTTSETPPGSGRCYSVRQVLNTGEIQTLCGLCDFPTSLAATKAAKTAADHGRRNVRCP